MDLVSIIIPAYNAENSIKDTLTSLLRQSYRNIEIIIVNDGSTDKTERICKEIEKKDSRVRLISVDNDGVSNARNKGIYSCKGKYVAFVDADDLVNKCFIENLIANISEDIDLVAEGYKTINTQGKYLFSQKLKSRVYNNSEINIAIECLQECKAFNVLWNKLFRRNIIVNNSIKMDATISMGEDLLFIIDYLKCIDGKIAIIDKDDYNYRLSPSGLQASFKENANLRLSQLEKIRNLYIQKNLPLKGLYLEYLRTFYTSILESKNKKNTIHTILNNNLFLELQDQNMNLRLKFKVFFNVLKTKNSFLIISFMKMIGLVKKFKKQSYMWK